MAALHHGATSAAATPALHRRRFTTENIRRVKPVFFISSSFTSFPAKNTRRRNHLRQKILKTLKTPIIPKLPTANPIVPIESQPQELKEIEIDQYFQEFEKFENSELAANDETQLLQELKEAEVTAPDGVGIHGGIGLAGKDSVWKYGLWFVGAFVFQTVCAVMFFGLDDIDNNRKIVDGSRYFRAKDAVLEENGNGKMGLRKSVVGDESINVDSLEMVKKIEEIRVMAREVREKEKLQSKNDGDGHGDGEDDEGTDGGKKFKSEIEEEVDGTMDRLRKKLGKTQFRTPLVEHSSGETKRGDENGDLMYRKKYIFRDFSGDKIEQPKGFVGSDDSRVNGDIEGGNDLCRNSSGDDNAAGLGDGERKIELCDDDPKGIDAVQVVEEDSKRGKSEANESTGNTRSKVTKEKWTSRQGRRKGVAKPKVVDGKSNVEAVKSGKASVLDTTVVSNKLSTGNGSVRGKGFGKTKSAIASRSETSLWWLNLPFVLVIFMRRGSGGEGLYTLKSISSRDEQISYTVAFEDRADATNFCYILESFFEELGDFKADVAPLTVKELKEAVKSYSLRALVVKRGQLQLYAGQPLTDAEMALRALIE